MWDKDGKPALGDDLPQAEHAALQFAVDTIKKHGIQPPGVMGWTDVSNNEAYMAGKLVTTNNGASLYYAMVGQEARAGRSKTLCVLDAGRAGRLVRRLVLLQLGASSRRVQQADLAEDLIRYLEDEKRFDRVHAGLGRAGGPGLQGPRGQPVLEVATRTSTRCCRTSCGA